MNYTQIPNEFFDEMAVLSNEEYGRLIRWMQRYAMTGNDDISMLTGNERLFAVRCKNVMDRFADAYNRKLEGSRKGVETRRKKAENNHTEPMEDQEEPEVNHRLTIGQPTLTTGDQTINHKPETINHKPMVYQNDIPEKDLARESEDSDWVEDFKNLDVPAICRSVCHEFNRLTGSRYSPEARYITDPVIKLLRQGYTEADLLTVIRKKYNEWKDTEMRGNVKPMTIFNPDKFGEYLAQPEIGPPKSKQRRQMEEMAAAISNPFESEVMQIDSG